MVPLHHAGPKASVTTMDTTVHSDVLQARYFVSELEHASDTLVAQIGSLERLQGGTKRADQRRRELYEVRRQIEALRSRFGHDI